MNTTQFILSSSGLIIGSSPIQNTSTGCIVFNVNGVAYGSDSLKFSNGIFEVGRTDTRSPGDFNTHIVQRWRNYAGTADLAKLTGDGVMTIGTYTNPSTQLSINSSLNYGIYVAGVTAIYAQNQQGAGSRYGIQSLGRSNVVGATAYGIKTGADSSSAATINYGLFSYAYNGATNYAAYLDSFGGTTNYALYVQRGKVNLGPLPTSSDGLTAGDLFTQTATQLGLSGTTKIICQL